MKYTLLMTAGLFCLAACGGTSEEGTNTEAGLKSDCLIIAADPEGVEEITEMGTDANGFCDCVVASVDGISDEDAEAVKYVMASVAAEMGETGGSADDIVGAMMRDSMANPDSEKAEMIQSGVSTVGNIFDDIGDGFDENGSCPAT
ncbi:MAG: hypothetical protein VX593_06570 [Pseudomonadota bacterium]|nr:hypothetical protein [Pseudomonadota bacterium]